MSLLSPRARGRAGWGTESDRLPRHRRLSGLHFHWLVAALAVCRACERDAACPISTEGWTRRVHFVREGGGGGLPSWPQRPMPHTNSFPSSETAADLRTDRRRSLFHPRPRAPPRRPRPGRPDQQRTLRGAPSNARGFGLGAHVSQPAATCVILYGRSAATRFGRCRLSRPPWPSCPSWLSPHEYTSPSAVTARVCRAPHAACLTLAPASAETGRGRAEIAPPPETIAPSWPSWLLPHV